MAGPISRAVLRLAATISRQVEVIVLTSEPLPESQEKGLREMYNIRVEYLPRMSANSISSYRSAQRIMQEVLKEEKPDLVHIHGAWNPLLTLMERTARKSRIVTCVTSHGGMAVDTINFKYLRKHIIPFLLYQAPLIRQCTSLIALSNKEWEDVRNLTIKKRVEIMPPMPEQGDNNNTFGTALLAAYRKAVDSSYRYFITKDEKELVKQVVISRATEVNEEKLSINIAFDKDAMSYKRIFFYAYDEDVLEIFHKKALDEGIYLPPLPDVNKMPRYVEADAKRRGDLLQLPQTHRKVRINETENPLEHNIVEMIARAKKEKLSRLTLRHLMEFYDYFHNKDFDEDVVAKELKRLRLKHVTRRIQKRMHRIFHMPEGYDIF